MKPGTVCRTPWLPVLLLAWVAQMLPQSGLTQCENFSIEDTVIGCQRPYLVRLRVANLPNDVNTVGWSIPAIGLSETGLEILPEIDLNGQVEVTARFNLSSGDLCVVTHTLDLQNTSPLQLEVPSHPNLIVCDPEATVQFRAVAPNYQSISWQLGAAFETGADIQYQFPEPGEYEVVLRGRDGNNCTQEERVVMRVIDPVQVNFRADPGNSGCKPFEVQLVPNLRLNDNTIQSYRWTTPGGVPAQSNAEQPTIRYETQGEYDVRLDVTTTDGCSYSSDVQAGFIQVSGDLLKPEITTPPAQICVGTPFEVEVANYDEIVGSIRWEGTARPVGPLSELPRMAGFQLNQAGTYEIYVVNRLGVCEIESERVQVEVKGTPLNLGARPFSGRYICNEFPHEATLVVLEDFRRPECEYRWEVYEQNADDPLFSTPFQTGNYEYSFTLNAPPSLPAQPCAYDVVLKARCPDCPQPQEIRQDAYIRFMPPPSNLGFQIAYAPQPICAGDEVDFTLNPTGPNLCDGSLDYAWFSQGENDPEPVRFSAAQNPRGHTFEAPGTYDITMEVSVLDKCTYTFDRSLQVHTLTAESATASVYSGVPCDSWETTLTLEGINNVPGGVEYIVEWQVEPDDGSVIFEGGNRRAYRFDTTAISQEVTFTRQGAYRISAVLQQSTNFPQTMNNPCSQVIEVEQPFYSGVRGEILDDNDQVCRRGVMRFEAATSFSTSSGYTWSVRPAAGVEITDPEAETAEIIFPDTGSYEVCLTTFAGNSNDPCARHDTCMTVQVEGVFFDFEPVGLPDTLSCETPLVEFEASGPDVPDNIRRYYWNFHDGSDLLPSVTPRVAHNFILFGDIRVTLTAEGENGCRESLEKSDMFYIEGPQPRFTVSPTQLCDSGLVVFENQSEYCPTMLIRLGQNLPILNREELATELVDSDSAQFRFRYRLGQAPPSAPDRDSVFVFQPQIIGIDGNCRAVYPPDSSRDTAQLNTTRIHIHATPQPAFRLESGGTQFCTPVELELVSESRYAVAYTWSLPENVTYTDSTGRIRHRYLPADRTTATPATVSLQAVNALGCAADTTRPIVLLDPPRPEISGPATACPDERVLFYDLSDYPTASAQRNWTYGLADTTAGDTLARVMGTGTGDPLTFVVEEEGRYLIRLEAADENGCTAQTDTLMEVTRPEAAFTANYAEGVDIFAPPDPVFQFTESSSGAIIDWQWDFGDGSRGSDERSPTYTYDVNEDLDATVALTVTDTQGCTHTAERVYWLRRVQFRAPSVFTPNGDGINDRFVITYAGDASYSLVIYDQFGSLVAGEFTQPLPGWDGRNLQGKKLVPGVYFWRVRIGDYVRTGTVSLFW